MAESDVFGEEEFLDLINLIFKDDDSDKNQYFDHQDGVIEEYISKNQNTNRYYTATCENRDGGTLIRIKINDFMLRVLNYSETRKIALSSIEKKISHHSSIHAKNCETFVIYQKFLIKGEPSCTDNPFNLFICSNIDYSENKKLSILGNQSPTIGIKRNTGFNSPVSATEAIQRKSEMFKRVSTSVNNSSEWTKNKQKVANKHEQQNSNKKVFSESCNVSDDDIDGENKKQKLLEQMNYKYDQQFKNLNKSYKIQFTPESCDDSIFEEKIPLKIKLMHKERQQQKQEGLQIYKFEQSRYEKALINQVKNKQQAGVLHKVFQTPPNEIEPYIVNKIEKLGYKLVKPKEAKEISSKIEQIPNNDLLQSICSPISEKSEDIMKISRYGGDNFNSIETDQQDRVYTPYNYLLSQKYSQKQKQRLHTPQKEKNIQLKPLSIVKQREQLLQNNKSNFENFYNGLQPAVTSLNKNNKQNNNLNISYLVSQKSNFLKNLNQPSSTRNKSEDVYHPLNYYQRSRQSSSNESFDFSINDKSSNKFRKFKVQQNNNSFSLNCSQITPIKSNEVCKTTSDEQNTSFKNLRQRNKINNRMLLKRVILDSL